MGRSKSKSKGRRARRKFTREFKADVVRLCRTGGETLGEVCRRLDLTESAVRAWVKQAHVDEVGGTPDALTTEERQELVRLRRELKQVRMERDISKKSDSLLRQGELVSARFEFMEAEKANFPVATMCRAFSVSSSGFYGWCKRPPSARELRRHELSSKVEAVFAQSRGTFGSPRVQQQLGRRGDKVSKNTVANIMREQGLQARRKKRFKVTTDSRNTKRVAPNLLARNFVAERPDQVWVTDVKAIWTLTGWLYLAPMLDLYARRVVAWGLSESNDTGLAKDALEQALRRRKPSAGITHHSDRGSPYGADAYIAVLDTAGAVRSMSRKGDCWDAVAESFFATLQHECLRDRIFAGYDETFEVLADYIDDFYNTERLHSANGYVSPVEFELRSALLQEAA